MASTGGNSKVTPIPKIGQYKMASTGDNSKVTPIPNIRQYKMTLTNYLLLGSHDMHRKTFWNFWNNL